MPECGFLWVLLESLPVISVQQIPDRCVLLRKPFYDGMEILGNPEATVVLSVDQTEALLAARLCDIAPDGSSLLVSWGLLNLTHRNGHENTKTLDPGEKFTAKVQAQRLRPCSQIRTPLAAVSFLCVLPSCLAQF